jgi:hypothetical protein
MYVPPASLRAGVHACRFAGVPACRYCYDRQTKGELPSHSVLAPLTHLHAEYADEL